MKNGLVMQKHTFTVLLLQIVKISLQRTAGNNLLILLEVLGAIQMTKSNKIILIHGKNYHD